MERRDGEEGEKEEEEEDDAKSGEREDEDAVSEEEGEDGREGTGEREDEGAAAEEDEDREPGDDDGAALEDMDEDGEQGDDDAVAQEHEEEAATHEGDGDENPPVKKKVKVKGGKATSCPDRKCVPGIIYLGHIPPRLRPKHLRNMLSLYGEIGRIFLQPEDKAVLRRKKRSGLRRCDFTEGWVEFRDKRVAKRVAVSLHNTPMATRKRQTFCSDLWCIKYLHRFQWTHLSERLAYEQSVLQQRLRTEVSQAKKETNFFLSSVDRSVQMDRKRKQREKDGEEVEEKTWDFTQRRTEEEIQQKKKRKHLEKTRLHQEKSQSNVSLLAKIFNTSQS